MIKIKIYKFRIDFNEYQKRININNTNVRSRRSEFRLVEEETPMKQEKETVRFLVIKQNNFNYLVLSFVLEKSCKTLRYTCYNPSLTDKL